MDDQLPLTVNKIFETTGGHVTDNQPDHSWNWGKLQMAICTFPKDKSLKYIPSV